MVKKQKRKGENDATGTKTLTAENAYCTRVDLQNKSSQIIAMRNTVTSSQLKLNREHTSEIPYHRFHLR